MDKHTRSVDTWVYSYLDIFNKKRLRITIKLNLKIIILSVSTGSSGEVGVIFIEIHMS